jgi:integrase
MKLKDITVKNAKSKEKIYRLFDGGGLYIEILPSGGKYWRFKYRFRGKEKRLALGVYPGVSLVLARKRREEARDLLENGVDPSIKRKMMKAAGEEASANTFEAIAREWLAKFSPNWAPGHTSKIQRRLERDIFPWFKGRAISEIVAHEILACVRRIEKRGAIETTHRALQNCGQVFRYAVATGRAERDICADLRGAIPPAKRTHHRSITDPDTIGALLRAMDYYPGSFVTRCALKLAPLVFVRPGELRKWEWKEIDFENSEWRIPPERMKMREQHIVPLSTQALAILAELKPVTESGKYVFPSTRSKDRPMSDATINAALTLLDYKDSITGHGFRSMASTLLNEKGWNPDAIERQLAHGQRDKVRGAYNYAEFLPERRKMMQWWADHLDEIARKNQR